MSSLKKRVSKLEPALGAGPGPFRIIIIEPVAAEDGRPAAKQPEITRARDMKTGEVLPRNAGESLEAFRQRLGVWAEQHSPATTPMVVLEGSK